MNTDDKIEALTAMVLRLTQTVADLQIPNQNNEQPTVNEPRTLEDKTLRLDIPDFSGVIQNPEDYLEWEASLERYFEYKDTSEEQQYKIAKMKITKLAAIWFEGVQRQRRRENRGRIDTWAKLKKHLRRKYMPPTYKQNLFVQWSTLRQGTRTVSEYIQEWEKVSVLCEVNEPEDMRLGKFIGGLREDLREKLEVLQNLTIESAFSSALSMKNMQRKESTAPLGLLRSDQTPL